MINAGCNESEKTNNGLGLITHGTSRNGRLKTGREFINNR